MVTETLRSSSRFDELIAESTDRMASIYFGEISKDVYIQTMFSSSSFDRFLNNLMGHDIKRIVSKTGHTLEEMISGSEQGDNTERVEQIKRAYDGDKSLSHRLARIALRIQRKRQPILNRSEEILQFKDRVSGYSREYLKDVERYKEVYGEQFFSLSAISRAGANVMAMRLFAQGNDLPQPPKKAMYAIALLHPLTDDYMDQGFVDSKIVQGISQKLAEVDVTTSNPYEKLVYDLIDDLFEDYPREEHPILPHILESLHQEQIRSLKQKDNGISREDIVDISLRKGGLSTLAAGYIALGGLTERQFKFFYELGALFQFIDDSADTTEDINDGVSTIWTSPILSGKDCDETLSRILGLHQHIRNQARDYVKDFTHPTLATTLYDKGFRALMLRGFFVNEEHFSTDTRDLVRRTLPAKYEEVKSLILYLHPRINGILAESSERGRVHIPPLLY